MSDAVGTLTATPGAIRYEFLMQAKRWAVWTVMPLSVAWGLFAFGTFVELAGHPAQTATGWAASWSLVAQSFAPVAFGILVSDRLVRDRRTGIEELLQTLPTRPGARMLGKYVGSVAATLIPTFAAYVAGSFYVSGDTGEPLAVPLGLLCFATINLPGLLFVAAFSLACPAVLWLPIYQTLFVGYWFWGNLLGWDSAVPTISGTILTPVGSYPASGFFGLEGTNAGDATAWEGAASVLLLVVLGGLALSCANRYLRWRQVRR